MAQTDSHAEIVRLCNEIKSYDKRYLTYSSPHMQLERIIQDAGYGGCLSDPFRIRRSNEKFEYLFQKGLCPKMKSGTYYFALPPKEHGAFFDTLGDANLGYSAETVAHQIMLTIIGEYSLPLATAVFLYDRYHSVDRMIFGKEIGIAMGLGFVLGAIYHPLQYMIVTKRALRKIRREYLPNAVFTTESLDPEVIQAALEGKIQK